MSIAASVFSSVFLACYLLLHHQSRLEPVAAMSTASVFEQGCHGVSLSRVAEARRCSPAGNKDHLPPKPLLVAAPEEAGEYPVLLFLHGYMAVNTFYSQLLHHVASHGFIVIGPQVSVQFTRFIYSLLN